jgi:hypothetical protein
MFWFYIVQEKRYLATVAYLLQNISVTQSKWQDNIVTPTSEVHMTVILLFYK